MLFNTPDFIIFFAVVLTTIVIIKNRKFQHLFILFASYFFFYYSSNYLIVLLIFTTLWDFYLGNQIFKTNNIKKRKLLLITSLVGNLGLLCFFKYADFAVTQFNILGKQFDLGTQIPLLNLALPIGISFYTFHSIGYIIDVYRGTTEPSRSLSEYAIFIAFFPQLVAGPILRARQFLPQLREKVVQFESGARLQIIIHNQNLKFGITLMAFGFFKKMFVADNVAPLVNDIFSGSAHESFSVMLGAIAFGIQIYADFSGYTDIAIGAAKILGFNLPINFNMPYFATSPIDFWRRWHISLSSWLRDYLYIPLGGNRKSKPQTFANIMIVMFLGGFWHGASWNFVIWGLMHGAYISIHKAISNKFPFLGQHIFFKSRVGILLSILVTQYFVFLAWLAFRIRNTDQLLLAIQKYVIWDFATNQTIQFILTRKFSIFIMVLFLGMHIISYKYPQMQKKISEFKLVYWTGILIIIMILIVLFTGSPENFIYFQF